MKKTIILILLLSFSIANYAQNLRIIGITDSLTTFRVNYPKNTLVLDLNKSKLFKLNESALSTQTLNDVFKSPISGAGGSVDLNELALLMTDTASSIRNWVTDKNYLSVESDPLFSSSPIASIQATDISSWNIAYGWGNHADVGYLKSFTETDPTWTLEKSNYALQSWVLDQNYLTSINEVDPLWSSEKADYATINWTNSQGFLKTVSETDPIWNSQKSSYATTSWANLTFLKSFTELDPEWNSVKVNYPTIETLADTANSLRNSINNVTVDSSNLFIDNGSEILLNSSRKLTIGTKQTFSFSGISNSLEYTYLDSILIPENSVIHVDLIAVGKTVATAGAFEHKTAYSNLAGILVKYSKFNWAHRQTDDPVWNFQIDSNNNYLRFKAKGPDGISIFWNYNIDIVIN